MDSGRAEARRLAAVLAADVVGYSRLAAEDEAGALAAVRALRRDVMEPEVARHGGRIFAIAGDGFLAEFGSAVAALRCALAVQEALRGGNPAEAGPRLALRIGVHQGDMALGEGGDITGDGVNLAVRLQGLAEPGGIAISARVHEDAAGKLALEAEDIGEQALKNIPRPVRVFRVRAAGAPIRSAPRPRSALPDRPSLAVLPFRNIGGDPEQEYFADGITEELTTALSRVRWFFVIARNSAFTYKGRVADVREVGRELGVSYVLEGSVRRAGGRVRIACELADAETGRHVWADRFDGDLTELFDLQDRATTAVASAVEPNLERAEIERVRHKSTESLGAYDLHLRAISGLESGTEEGTAEAVGLLRRALALDPDYALALADLALCVLSRARAGWQEDSEAGFQEAVALARRALGADRSDAFVLAAAGYVFSVTLRAHEESAELAERAIALNGNSAFVWELSGAISLNAGEFEEAIRRQEMVMRLDPLSTASRNAQTGMALAHFFSRRFEEAERWARRALAARPALISARNLLAASVAMQGRGGEARALMADIRAGNAQASLSRARRLNGFRHGWMTELWVEALRRAGVPE